MDSRYQGFCNLSVFNNEDSFWMGHTVPTWSRPCLAWDVGEYLPGFDSAGNQVYRYQLRRFWDYSKPNILGKPSIIKILVRNTFCNSQFIPSQTQ